jgi:glycosyltransferase involved in cell wall biosynthesis
MACGTAVACSDAPALVELTGDAAVRFPAIDVGAGGMAAAIAEGLDRRDELAQRALARATAYSPARTAASTVDVYREALDRPPSSTRYHP